MRLFKSKDLNMTEGKPLSLLISFSIPLIFGNVFQQMYTVTDTAIVGQGVGMLGLAALGAVDWLTWLPFSIPQGFAQGFSVRASQKYGEGDMDGVRRIVGHSAVISILLGLLCTILFVLGVPLFMRLLKVRAELVPLASVYLYILFGGCLFSAFYNFAASMLRAVGDSRTPFVAMVISSILNIVLDALAVFVLHWGIAGAGAATVFSQIVAGIFCLVKLRKNPVLCFTRQDMKLERTLSGQLLGLGLPMSMMNVILCVGGLIVVSVVNTCSIPFVAGYTAPNKIYGLLEIAAISYSYAIMTYVGQNFGAGKMQRIRKGVRTGVILSIFTAIGIAALMLIFGKYVLALFMSKEDPQLYRSAMKTAKALLACMSLGLPLLYMLYAYRASLQGLGDTTSPMISGLMQTVVRSSLAIIAARTGKEELIFFVEPSAWFVGLSWVLIMYYVHRAKLMSGDTADEPTGQFFEKSN